MQGKNIFVAALASLVILVLASRAEAGAAGREIGRSATYIYSVRYVLQANKSYVVETLDLSPGADTILHVQASPAGDYVDGNDDCGTRLPRCVGSRSWLSIAASPVRRNVVLIVRAYSTSTGGTGTLRVTPYGSPAVNYPISFTAGTKKTFRSIRQHAHMLTVEEQGGSADTILIVTSATPASAIKYSDDHGVGLMSWVDMPQSCTTSCAAIVGARSISTQGSTTFIWDEDVHFMDNDGDGLSDTFEGVLGSLPGTADTDGDGLSDGVEVIGIDTPTVRLRIPYYGADLLAPDLFIEADWKECVPNGPTDLTTCGNPPNPDRWRVPVTESLKVASLYYGPDVKVHIDTGVQNTDPATREVYGAWGGAFRMPTRDGNKCQWLSADRVGYFHGGRIEGASGGQGSQPGMCFDAGYGARAISHESGHNFNLSHGGLQSGGADLNCKPNYKSIMSYALLYESTTDPRFSRGQFNNVSLNPSQMDEMYGLGTSDLGAIAHLATGAFRYMVESGTGAVDWNRDGRFTTGFVRAAPTWGWGAGGCEPAGFAADTLVWKDTNYANLGWFSGFSSGGRLYLFSRRTSDSKIEYRYATEFPEDCGSPPSPTCKTDWVPAMNQPARLLPSSPSGVGAPAASEFLSISKERVLVLVYKDTQSRLAYQLLTVGSFPSTELWSVPAFVDGGVSVVSGDPAVVRWNDEIHLYAVLGGLLKQWRLTPDGQWSGPVEQSWAGGAPVEAKYGIGVAQGYLRLSGVSSLALIAAVPITSPAGQIEMAWLDANGQWSKLDVSAWPQGRAITQAQPGIAYVPFDPTGDIGQGRFHLAWNPPDAPGTRYAGLMSQSEGNDLTGGATDRGLVWDQAPIFQQNEWHLLRGNVALLYDLRHDRSLKLASTWDYGLGARGVNFYPFADGVFDSELRDQNDYEVISSNLRCSLGLNPACL